MKFPIALSILAALAVVHSAPIPTPEGTGLQILHHTGSVDVQSQDLNQSLKKREAVDDDDESDNDLKKRETVDDDDESDNDLKKRETVDDDDESDNDLKKRQTK